MPVRNFVRPRSQPPIHTSTTILEDSKGGSPNGPKGSAVATNAGSSQPNDDRTVRCETARRLGGQWQPKSMMITIPPGNPRGLRASLRAEVHKVRDRLEERGRRVREKLKIPGISKSQDARGGSRRGGARQSLQVPGVSLIMPAKPGVTIPSKTNEGRQGSIAGLFRRNADRRVEPNKFRNNNQNTNKVCNKKGPIRAGCDVLPCMNFWTMKDELSDCCNAGLKLSTESFPIPYSDRAASVNDPICDLSSGTEDEEELEAS